jgi:hypothetical protein
MSDQPEPDDLSDLGAKPVVNYASQSQSDIVARGATYFRMTRIGMLILLVGIGAWFVYDGFFHWPAENALFTDPKLKPPHTWMDIMLNRALGIVLPPCGVFALALGLRQSRGEIRLSGSTLSVPGHAPILLDQIESIDKSLWEKKGIAIVEYHLSDGSKRKFRLDDYIYERSPIDEIFEIIEETMSVPGSEAAEPVTFPRAAKTKTAPGHAPRVPTGKLPPNVTGPRPPAVRMPPPPRNSPPPTRLPPRPKRDI